MRSYRAIVINLLWFLLSACNLTTQPPTNEPIIVPTVPGGGGGRPVVNITSPKQGDEVAVNTQLFVTAIATDSVGVTRVQLKANDEIVKTVSSQSPSGDQSFPVLIDYTPRTTGTVTLELTAFRGPTSSDPASVQITVRASQTQVVATIQPPPNVTVPVIDPNDPTCRALANVGLNLRTGPGTNFDRITVLPAGTVTPIIGRIASNLWLQVQFGTRVGWISAQNPTNASEKYVTLYGNCLNVAIINPPPTPTPIGTVPPILTATLAPTLTLIPSATPTPGLPDLIVSSIAGDTVITIPTGTGPVTRTYTVSFKNQGSGPSPAFNATLIRQPDGFTIATIPVSALPPGQLIAVPIVNITFPEATQLYVLRVTADPTNTVPESNETNNETIISVQVTVQ